MNGTCEICRGQLLPHVVSFAFRDASGRQEYHPPEMARWMAGMDGRSEDLVEFHYSTRASKLGLVTGYAYQTDKFGADGLGRHCSMQCQAVAVVRATTTDKGPAKATGGHETAGIEGVAASLEPIKDVPGEITGRRMQQIRRGLGLTTNKFAQALGYHGGKGSNETIIARFECGARPIPTAIGRLAAMFELVGAVPRFRRMDYGQELRGSQIPGRQDGAAKQEEPEAETATATDQD